MRTYDAQNRPVFVVEKAARGHPYLYLAESVRDAAASAAAVDLRSSSQRPLPVLGNALAGEFGILPQQSAAAQSSPFLRGLTGYQVLNLVDGIRFNNSTFRSGPNQYLSFVDPGQVSQVEAVMGPATSIHGSDAMGGSVQFLSVLPSLASPGAPAWRGAFGVRASTADNSVGSHLNLSYAGRTVGVPPPM